MAMTSCSEDRDHLLMLCGGLHHSAVREQMMGARPTDASEIVMVSPPLGRNTTGWCDQTHPGIHRQRLDSTSRRQDLSEWRDACPQRRILEILVKKAEGGVTFVVGK